MKDLPPSLRRNMTFDNGKEFAEHVTLTKHLGLEIYFAEPYASWQRGTNENTNGLLRQYFPHGTDLASFTQADLNAVAQRLNSRPRKTLGYATPADRLANTLLH